MAMQKNGIENPAYLTSKWSRAITRVPQYPCTVIEAPIGYGKTTFAREAAKRLNEQIIWQKFFEKSASQFWRGFSSAFSNIDEESAGGLQSLGFLESSLMERELTQLLAELRIARPVCIILDDYHNVRSDSSDMFLSLLIENMPENLRLILTTRERVGRTEELLSKGLIHAVRTDDLSFSREDIPAYFKTRGISLSREEVVRLYEYTEGWISTLYLFALDYQRSGGFAYTSSIPELVYHAVYSPLDEEMKDFLLSVCLFDGFGPEEASAVWLKGNSMEILNRLMSTNTLITRDGETGRYSLHNILGQCMLEQFKLLPESNRKERLHAAGEALYRARRYMSALSCFERAEDFDGILQVLGDCAHSCDLFGDHKELFVRCYLSCPPDKLTEHPIASLCFAMDMITQFYEPALYERAKIEFLRAMRENQTISQEERAQLTGEYEQLLSFEKFNDLIAMGHQNARAAALLKKPPRFLFTKGSFTFAAPSLLCLYHRESGGLKKLAEYLASAPGSYTKSTEGHGQGFMPMFLAERLYACGEMENAGIEAYRSTEIARAAGQGDVEMCGLFLLSRLALFNGNLQAIIENRQKILGISRRMSRGYGAYRLIYTCELCAIWLDLCLGDSTNIPEWIIGREYLRYLPYVTISCADVVLGRALLERGECERLLGLSEVFLQQAGIFPNILAEIYIRIDMAAAFHKLGRIASASEALRQALAIAAPDDLAMPFVENAIHIRPVLDELSKDAAYAAFIRRVKTLADTYNASVLAIRLQLKAQSAPTLTLRERQLGLLAAEGQTNAQIADMLGISLNTVKTEMKNLFAKLEIGSRALLKKEMFGE